MGRKPIGRKAMSDAERQRRHRKNKAKARKKPKMISVETLRRMRWHDRLINLMRREDWDWTPVHNATHQQQVKKLAARYAVLRDQSSSPRDIETLNGLIDGAEKYLRLCADVHHDLMTRKE